MNEEETTHPTDERADDLITISEGAALLGVHRTTVHRLLEAGKLPGFYPPARYRNLGKKRLLRRGDVELLAQSAEWRKHPRRRTAAPEDV